jgi:hypothetical protein
LTKLWTSFYAIPPRHYASAKAFRQGFLAPVCARAQAGTGRLGDPRL